MVNWEIATVFVGGIATLGIYTFLVKENPIYRFFEHLFIGVAAGFLPVLTIRDFLWPRILRPLLGLEVVAYPDGTVASSYNYINLIFIIPILLGLLYYSIYFKRFSWMSHIVIGISLGVSAGLGFKGFFVEMIPQLLSSFKPLIVVGSNGYMDLINSFSNCVFIITLITVMWYFLFSIRLEPKLQGGLTYLGRWLMMICFGAFFGSTVMARMALLVERVTFLTIDWWEATRSIFTG